MRWCLWLCWIWPAVVLAAPRIISTSPRNTEILFQIGLGQAVVATSTFSDYPEAAKRLPTLGPLFMPSLERTLTFRADLACIDPFTTPASFQQGLHTAGITTLPIEISDLQSLFAEARKILSTVSAEDKDAAINTFATCRDRTIAKYGGRPFRFLAFTWTDPPILFGHRTLLSDLLTKLGGTNGLPTHGDAEYPQLAEEWLMRHPPDIAFALVENEAQLAEHAKQFARWWPPAEVGGTVRQTAMLSEFFGRASFSPVREAWRLVGAERPEECRP